MKDCKISINQLAEFSSASVALKKRIIKQQKIPNKFLIPWYQQARSATKKFLTNVKDISPINEAIVKLNAKTPANNRQKIDKSVSLEALESLKKINLPIFLSKIDYEVIALEERSLIVDGVNVIVAPDVVFRTIINRKVTYGGAKIHICKTKPFDLKQSNYVATALHRFLIEKVAEPGEYVMADLCFCLDIFAERFTSAAIRSTSGFRDIKSFCSEIKTLWAAA